MIGTTISHYKILEKLGGGGMGVVYKAEDTKLRRTVALKFLPPDLVHDDESKQRFIHEAQAASALQHNNICVVHDIDETADGQMFIVMDLYQGGTLKKKIEAGPLGITEALEHALQIADGLAEAHKRGIIHRDLKPANIMIAESGVAKIVDFGLAKFVGMTKLTRTGSTLGTIAYMSPEQLQGAETDARADIFSLGVVIFEMLTGQLPFRGDHEASLMYSIVNDEPQSILKLRPETPDSLAKTVDKMLKKDVGARFQSMDSVVQDLRQCLPSRTGAVAPLQFLTILKRPVVAIPTVLVFLGLCFLSYWWITMEGKRSWARTIAIPEIERLAEEGKSTANGARYVEALRLAREAEKYIPNDTTLSKLYPRFCGLMRLRTTPAGAAVYIQEYTSPQGEWEYLGNTPLDSVRVPYAFFRWKLVKKGYDTVFAVAPGWRARLSRVLDTIGSIPQGMVRVRGDSLPIPQTGNRALLRSFFIDKYEVTNAQFKKFMDAGAYKNRQFWQREFIREGKKISWEEAMGQFVDATGRPGPSTWQAGDYPDGRADYPVSGISWYEAAAYAEFAGKHLPTQMHWVMASFGDMGRDFGFFMSVIVPLSNFEAGGPARVGSYPGMDAFGAYDMAGNVREWCWNETKTGRVIRGGAWNETSHMYQNLSQALAFDRSSQNGVRCVRYIEGDSVLKGPFAQPLDSKSIGTTRDYTKEKPVNEATFRLYRDQFLYDKMDLNAKIEAKDSTSGDWIKEKITFDAAYGRERMIAYVFLPKRSTPPFQVVIYFPGSTVIAEPNSGKLTQLTVIDFIVKNGRAVVYPIYCGTYERNTFDMNPNTIWPAEQFRNIHSELTVKWVKDFKRTVDYLYTRPDIDTSRIGYYGFSWGGLLGPVITATEQRLKASVLYLGGFALGSPPRPEADNFNFAPRVSVPTLLLSGKYDMTFPYETSAKPMFDLLGTPAKHKRNMVYATAHYIPKSDLIKETLEWFDKYLGPVK